MANASAGRARRLHGVFRTAAAHLISVRDLVRFGVTEFSRARLAFGHGSDNALDEATYLVLHTLGLPLDQPNAFLDAKLLPDEVRNVLYTLQRRVRERIPAAYLTREAWIGPHRFYVDQRVIVPRSYIGEWLRDGLAPWIERPEQIGSALDLCTGSGCLAVLLALRFPDARIDAVDLSEDALAVARRNVEDYGLRERIRLVSGDLFEPLGARRYDLIVSNPPYVAAMNMAALPPEYRHEPALALAGGADGLDVVRRILAQARRHLTPRGMLVVETGHARDRVEQLWPRLPFTWIETSQADDAVFLLTRAQLV